MEPTPIYGQDEEKIKPFSVRIPPKIHKLAQLNYIETGKKINVLIVELLTDYFKAQGKLPE